ncbi:ribose 5-phosphate isomerase B [Brevibacillus daliensis]|uniref:ribose 5-phosphate isomerase B n=1 Tax=Brevibacillus daliensis TaxID=2892995 RepID=UPI001E5926F9|nr:ribose 5-phosphate isomerase B [Brevibacillus daliensis]
MKIAIGCDQNAYEMKMTVIELLKEKGVEVTDFGSHQGEVVDYPDVAFKVAEEIRDGNFDRGILVCGTGIGVAIAANKVQGVYAACAHDTYSAERARKSNNAQILTMGAKVIGLETAKQVVKAWLDSEFEGRSQDKIDKISKREQEQCQKA